MSAENLVAVESAAHAHLRDVIQSGIRRKIYFVAIFRSILTARHEEVARAEYPETLHHRPELALGERVDDPVRLGPRGKPIVRVIGSVEEPSLERQTGRVDEMQDVVDRVTAVAAVQERIDDRAVVRQFPALDVDVALYRMSLRQQGHRLFGHLDAKLVLLEFQVTEDGLQNLDADPAVFCVHRQADGAVLPQDGTERLEADLRVRRVVQNTGRDD